MILKGKDFDSKIFPLFLCIYLGELRFILLGYLVKIYIFIKGVGMNHPVMQLNKKKLVLLMLLINFDQYPALQTTNSIPRHDSVLTAKPPQKPQKGVEVRLINPSINANQVYLVKDHAKPEIFKDFDGTTATLLQTDRGGIKISYANGNSFLFDPGTHTISVYSKSNDDYIIKSSDGFVDQALQVRTQVDAAHLIKSIPSAKLQEVLVEQPEPLSSEKKLTNKATVSKSIIFDQDYPANVLQATIGPKQPIKKIKRDKMIIYRRMYGDHKIDTYQDGTVRKKYANGNVEIVFADGSEFKYNNDNDDITIKYKAGTYQGATRLFNAAGYKKFAREQVHSLQDVQKLCDIIRRDLELKDSSADKAKVIKSAKCWFPIFNNNNFNDWIGSIWQSLRIN